MGQLPVTGSPSLRIDCSIRSVGTRFPWTTYNTFGGCSSSGFVTPSVLFRQDSKQQQIAVIAADSEYSRWIFSDNCLNVDIVFIVRRQYEPQATRQRYGNEQKYPDYGKRFYIHYIYAFNAINMVGIVSSEEGKLMLPIIIHYTTKPLLVKSEKTGLGTISSASAQHSVCRKMHHVEDRDTIPVFPTPSDCGLR